MAGSMFGWDLLYRSIENEIKCDGDVLLALTHFYLISQGFKCVGIGESTTIDGSELEGESLPKAWNDCYALRYKKNGRLYNLKGTKLDDGVIFNLIRVDEKNVAMVQLNNRAVVTCKGTLDEMIPNHKDVGTQIQSMIDKVSTSNKSKEVSSQTESQTQSTSATQSNSRLYERPLLRNPLQNLGPVGVGEYDLHPLGRNPLANPSFMGPGGGGMLFEPPRRPDLNVTGPGLPFGSVPPGARFDPIRPPNTDPRVPRNRYYDEMPPPGYDDMFM